MASKSLFFLSLILVLLIASEVAAKDLAEKSPEYKNNGPEADEEKQTEQYGGYGGNSGGGYGGRGRGYCRYGCCYGGYYRCYRCCGFAGDAKSTKPGH